MAVVPKIPFGSSVGTSQTTTNLPSPPLGVPKRPPREIHGASRTPKPSPISSGSSTVGKRSQDSSVKAPSAPIPHTSDSSRNSAMEDIQGNPQGNPSFEVESLGLTPQTQKKRKPEGSDTGPLIVSNPMDHSNGELIASVSFGDIVSIPPRSPILSLDSEAGTGMGPFVPLCFNTP